MAAHPAQATAWTMKLKSARPLEGYRWMVSGVQLAARHPLAFFAAASLFSFVLAMLLAFPWIGMVMVFVLLPALNVGWVATASAAAAGRTPAPWLLFIGLRSPRRGALMRLGAVYALLAVAVLLLADVVDSGFQQQWEALLMASRSGGDAAPGEGLLDAVQHGALLRGLMLVPLVLALWHAPVIVMQAGAGVGKALFGSVLATWRNLPAFAVFGLSWVAADVAFSSVLALVLTALGLGGVSMLVVLPFALFFMSAFYASLRASIAGCIDFESLSMAPADTPAEP